MPDWVGDCGDIVPSLFPTVILPRLVHEATVYTLDIIGSAIGVDLTAIYSQIDEIVAQCAATVVEAA